MQEKLISIVVPVYNEEGNVEELHQEIVDVVKKESLKAEIILVDDGSTDGTREKIRKLRPVRAIFFRRNFGQTAAMDAGIKAARGKIIVTMDGDRQNDPADIPKLLKKIEGGLDVVSGWRKNRQDPFLKKFLSRGADKLRKFLINDQINDSGCSLKAYRSECFNNMELYGEMHRFIPGLLKIKGFRIGEVVVNHRPRTAGKTKYNWKRLVKGVLDLLSIWFWRKFASRPLHLFGTMGVLISLFGILILAWMLVEKVVLGAAIGGRIWPMVGFFSVILGIQFFVSGLLADIGIKTYYQTRKEQIYNIKERLERE
jgi:glycosyltransferase involved in cell wall biosynthesis